MEEKTTFLGFDKKQIPLLSLLLGGFVMLAGMFYQVNSNLNALNANLNSLRAETNANFNAMRAEMNANDNALGAEINTLRSDMNANDNALRSEIRSLDDRVDALTVKMAETNARLENIERQLPFYNSLIERLGILERAQTRLTERLDAFINGE